MKLYKNSRVKTYNLALYQLLLYFYFNLFVFRQIFFIEKQPSRNNTAEIDGILAGMAMAACIKYLYSIRSILILPARLDKLARHSRIDKVRDRTVYPLLSKTAG